MDFNAIWARLLRALKLEPGVFEEIGNDEQATGQAVVIAIAASLIGGISSIGDGFGSWLFGALIGAPIGLIIGAGILFLLSKLFKGEGEYIHLVRGLGYASAPSALSLVPFLGWIVGAVYAIILAIRAVQEICRVSTGAAAAIVLIPAALVFLLVFILVVLAGIAFLGFAAANS